MSPLEMPLSVGARVGPYEIAEAIGAGGMGVVFRARDHALRRDVAIKILPAAIAADPDRRQRFAREARLLAAVSHPHIAQVYSVEESSAGSAIVMELVAGSTLRHVIRAKAFGTRDALAYARQIALALDAAHERGIIHRDLKPDNVMVTADGTVKVLDFGLAKAWAGDDPDGGPDTMTRTVGTLPGQVVGTVGYMSPEQARGHAVDRRTDIWAFGCILFEMFVGRPPFEAPTASDTIAAVLERDPDWTALPPSTPSRVRHLISRCLEKDRRRRLRDIGDALPELDTEPGTVAATGAHASFGRPASGSPGWRPIAIAFAAVAVLLSATTVWLWSRSASVASSRGAQHPVRFALPPPPGTRFGSDVSSIEATTISFAPDGTRLAFIATGRTEPPRIFIRALDAEDARAIPGTEGAVSVFWSPDGRSLAFFAAGKLKRVDTGGGAPVALCDVPLGVGLHGTWGSSGDILYASVQGDAIMRVSASGGPASTRIGSNDGRRRTLWPHFLPDGQRFLFTSMTQDADGRVVLVDRDGTERPIMQAVSQAQFIEPDLVLIVRESTLLAQRVDLSTGRPVGEPVSVIGSAAYSAATGWAEVTASPVGMLALRTHRDVSHMIIVDRSGKTERTVGTPGVYLGVRAAPDGSALLFSRLRPDLGTFDIWSIDAARGSETPLTREPGMETGEVWLPGMRSMVFAAARRGPPNLFFRDLASGKERRLAQSARFQFPTDVSPDGMVVAYQQRTEVGNFDLMQLRLDDTTAVRPIADSPASETDLRFAPAGERVAFVSDESGRPEIYVAPFPSTSAKIMVSAGGGYLPRWRRDGRELYYMSPGSRMMAVSVGSNGQPSAARPLFAADRWANFDVMDNGARFVAIVRESVALEQPLTVLLNWRQVMAAQ